MIYLSAGLNLGICLLVLLHCSQQPIPDGITQLLEHLRALMSYECERPVDFLHTSSADPLSHILLNAGFVQKLDRGFEVNR